MFSYPVTFEIVDPRRHPANAKAPKAKEMREPSQVSICLKKFKAEDVKITLNRSTGLMTVNAQREETVETGRNCKGQRKTTVCIEQTAQLPEYVVKEALFDEIETKFERNCLAISWPEKSNGVAIPVTFEMDDGEEEEEEDSLHSEVKDGFVEVSESIDVE